MPGKLAMLFNIYGQFIHKCKSTETSRRVVADALLSILNHPETQERSLAKMQSDLRDKGVHCDLTEAYTYKLLGVKYTVDKADIRTVIAYEFRYSTRSGKQSLELSADIPTRIYTEMVGQTSQAKVVRLVAYYVLIGALGGNFWGLFPTFYQAIEGKFGTAAVECFASPFNHTLPQFYSLLSPIERQYGSVGDFFKDFIMDEKYMAYVINPPFIEPVMQQVFRDVQEKLANTRKVSVILYLPYWRDIVDPFIKQVRDTKHRVAVHVLQKNRSIVYDYIKEVSFTARFETVVIYCTNSDSVDGPLFRTLVNTMTK